MGELVLKLGALGSFSQWLQEDINKDIWKRKLSKEVDYTVDSIRYMTGIDEDKEKLLNLINSIDEKNKEIMAKVAEQLRQESIENKSISIARNMLMLGMDVNTVKDATDLTIKQIKEIKLKL